MALTDEPKKDFRMSFDCIPAHANPGHHNPSLIFRSSFQQPRNRIMDGILQIRSLSDFDVNYPGGKDFSGAEPCAGARQWRNSIRSRFHFHLTFLALSSSDLGNPVCKSFERMIR